MEDIFKLEIISPEKIILSEDVKMVTLPSYEGEMGVLKNHISIITFLRPGIIRVQKKEEDIDDFFVQDGTVEYFNDNLIVLSASVMNIKDLSKEFVDNLNKDTQEKLEDKNITDHDRYILNHKLNALKEVRI
jgi:ATP synthase F1 epsilon subunit|tara:strand:- start:1126 stop:1521 length:396 start_codon:yes stop_codon:yes gene_type:complete